MKYRSVLLPLNISLLIGLLGALVACGGSAENSAPPPPGGSIPAATTTLQAETGNNTSAADSFLAQTNGNARAGNVSKVPLRSLLYRGSDTRIYTTWLGWFGKKDHMSVGYNSADAGQVHRQVTDMISRGIQGAIAAWYGPANPVIDAATMLLRDEAEAHPGQFEFAIMEDVGALGSAAVNHGCDVTDQLISDLTYVAAHFESSPAYMQMNGRPVIFFFGVDAYYIDWNRVISSIPGNPLLIFQGTNGLNRTPSDGGFAWVGVDASNPFDLNLAAQATFYKAAQQTPERLAFGSAYKGFNDSLAAWGTNRITNQQCGQAWQQTFSEAGKFYSSGDQLPAIQIATWNDYEEGTAIEPGIDNCIYLAPSQSGTTIAWSVNGGDENTVDHYTVFISTDGANLAKLGDVPAGTHSFDLGPLKLPGGTYSVYIKATGAPSFQNKMSPAMAYHPGDQPPDVALNISQTGALAYKATAAASSGTIARSVIDFGDGTVITGLSAAHTYKTVGTYLITASEYDAAGASTVVVHQISAKPSAGGITVLAPGAGSTVNWPTMLAASANPGTPVSVMRVLIDGQQAYATNGDTINTAIKIFTGSHQISVQSFDLAGNKTASTSFNVLAEPNDLPPVARIAVQPMPNLSRTTVLGCTVTSSDPDGFLISRRMQYSDGSHFSTPAALETFPAIGNYTATVTVMDQFGATDSKSITFSVDANGKTAVVRSEAVPEPVHPGQQRPLQPIDLP